MTRTRTPPASAAARIETVPHALRLWAQRRPGAPAVTQGLDELDYRGLDRAVTEAARRLMGTGVTEGGRVVLAGTNTLEWVIAFLACLRAGAIVVPLNIRSSPLEVGRQLELCEPDAIFASEDVLPLIVRAYPAEGIPVFLLDREAGGRRSFWRLPAPRADEPTLTQDAPALISFTSGSTGTPKGALIQHGALVRSAAAFVPHLETSSADATLTLVPLFHNTGFVDQLTQMLLVGGTVDLLPEYGTEAAIEALVRRPASYLIAVPSILRLLMLHERAEAAFGDCRVAVYGGAPMPTGWIHELRDRWPWMRLFNCYGLTEFTSVSHLLDPEYALTHSGSVGRPVRGVQHRVVGDDDKPLPSGEVGEVWVSGPMRMAEYWRAEVETLEVFRDPWLRTGDLGTIEDDFLTLLGRSADVINRGGEKVYTAQVESALSELPALAEAAVVGAPHSIFVEQVLAWVVARTGSEFDENATRQHLLERVPEYAVPEAFVVVDELPRNAAGKLDRAQLREEAARVFGEEEG